jgi:hypothetical protein
MIMALREFGGEILGSNLHTPISTTVNPHFGGEEYKSSNSVPYAY